MIKNAPHDQLFLDGLDCREEECFRILVERVFSNPRRFGFLTVDEAAEAFMKYRGRLKSILRKGVSIQDGKDCYLDTCIRYLAKSLKRSIRSERALVHVLENAESYTAGEVVQISRPPSGRRLPSFEERQFIEGIAPSFFLSRMSAERKRLLFLILKCSWEMDDDTIEKASRVLGVPVIWLGGLVHQGQSSLDSAIAYRQVLTERANAQWVRQQVIEARMLDDSLGADMREKLDRSPALCRRRRASLLERKRRCRLLVSHKTIAAILKVPKGSIDSGIFYLREKEASHLEAAS